ncbi:hypothetical protein BDV98DRAFT_482785, partial [Pterulicium gracile]
KPGASQYYPACCKPDNYTVSGSDHPYVDLHLEGLEIVRQSQNQAQYEKNRLETGMCKPSIILGLSSNHRLHIPSCFPGDDMHRPALNQAGDLFLPLW